MEGNYTRIKLEVFIYGAKRPRAQWYLTHRWIFPNYTIIGYNLIEVYLYVRAWDQWLTDRQSPMKLRVTANTLAASNDGLLWDPIHRISRTSLNLFLFYLFFFFLVFLWFILMIFFYLYTIISFILSVFFECWNMWSCFRLRWWTNRWIVQRKINPSDQLAESDDGYKSADFNCWFIDRFCRIR